MGAHAALTEKEILDANSGQLIAQVRAMEAAAAGVGVVSSKDKRKVKKLKREIRHLKRRRAKLDMTERYITATEEELRTSRREIRAQIAWAEFVSAMKKVHL